MYLRCHEPQQVPAQVCHLPAVPWSRRVLPFVHLWPPPLGLMGQLPVQGAFPLGPEPHRSCQKPERALAVRKLELQPAVSHHARAVAVGVQGPAEEQKGLEGSG